MRLGFIGLMLNQDAIVAVDVERVSTTKKERG